MTQRLFQDAAGTIPAILAGQPVGLSIRAAGQQNASQATALSKPTLARWPMTGRRNIVNVNTFEPIAVGRTTTYDAGGMQVILSRDGITATVTGKGEHDGIPYIEISYAGTSSASSNLFYNIGANNPAPFVGGEAATVSAYVALLSGVPPTMFVFANFGPATISGFANQIMPNSVFTRYVALGAVPAGKNVFSTGGVYARVSPGQSVDFTIRVGGVQVEKSASVSALQLARSANDITEPGVKDLWHLYNDGGDSLNIILPAGTYGSAHLAIDRSYNVGSVVSDGVTPLTTLTTERQIDAIYRLGEFSAGEREALLKYWQEEYPL